MCQRSARHFDWLNYADVDPEQAQQAGCCLVAAFLHEGKLSPCPSLTNAKVEVQY
jgi:hypothetical protein